MSSGGRPQVHLLLNYHPGDASALEQYLPTSRRDRVKIIVYDRQPAKELLDRGFDVSLLADYAPIDSKEDTEAYDYAYHFTRRVEARLACITYRGIPVFPAIDSRLTSDLVFLKVAETALGRLADAGYDHAVFALPYYNYGYLALLDFATSRGVAPLPYAQMLRHGELAPLLDPVTDSRIERALRLVAGGERLGRYGLVRKLLALALRAYPTVRAARHSVARLCERIARSSFSLREIGATRRIATMFYVLTNDYDLFLKPLYPVFAELRRTGHDFLVFSHQRAVVDNLRPHGVEAIYLPDVLPTAYRLRSTDRARYTQVLQVFVAELERLLQEEGQGSLWGDGERPLEYFLLEHLKQRSVREPYYFYDALQLIDFFDEAFWTLRPHSVVLMPDCYATFSLIAAVARTHAIPSITTVAASLGRTFRSVGAYSADIMAADGLDTVEAVREAWFVHCRPVLTGSPMFDKIATASLQCDREYLSSVLDLNFSKRIVLVATSRIDPNEAVWIERLVEIAARRADLEVVVKVHPNWYLIHYDPVVQRCAGKRFHLVRDVDLHALINVADVVVTDYSHAGREALMFDKPLLQVNLTGSPFPTNRYAEMGVALGVSALDELDEAVRRILEDDALRQALAHKRKAIIDHYNYRNDGRATERVCRLLLDPWLASVEGGEAPAVAVR